jgi:hypothetical protein
MMERYSIYDIRVERFRRVRVNTEVDLAGERPLAKALARRAQGTSWW